MVLARENDYAMYLYTCNRCRSCAFLPEDNETIICPSYAASGFFTHTGGGRAYAAQGILEGKIKPSEELAKTAMECLLCGACASACPPGFDILAFIRDLRDHLVSAGFFANPAHRRLIENTNLEGNPWAAKPKPVSLPSFKPGMDILIWLGCRERIKNELLPAVVRVLRSAGLSFGALAEEPCCGAPLLDLGDKQGFIQKAELALEAINSSRAERLLILCPHCAGAMVVDYALEIGDLEPEPLTLPQLLAELVQQETLSLKSSPPQKITYHDPCRLARGLEQKDEPRKLFVAMEGVELAEMERSRGWTWCCGAGGWTNLVAGQLARLTARQRVKEAKNTDADLLLTSCSYCRAMLRSAGGKNFQVRHLVEFISDRISA